MSTAALPVVFVESYPQALAGQQETLLALLDHARQSGIAATLLTPSEGVFVKRLRARNHAVEVVPQPETIRAYGGAVYRYGPLQKLRMVFQVLGYVARLRRHLRARGYCAVFCNDMRGLLTVGLAARQAGIPVLIWDKLDKPHGLYDALQLPLASRNLMISNGVARKYPAWQKRLWSARIRVVRNGIDLTRFRPAERNKARETLGLDESQIVLAIVGTVTERKGHDLLFKALHKAREQDHRLQLLVIGQPDDASAAFADRMRATAPPGVSWLGHRHDLYALLPAVDIMVSPSRHEGMGRVNVEAMATEIPVIGSADTGIAEVVVNEETGLLVNSKDSDALCDAILRLSRNSDLRMRMGKAARARVEAEFEVTKQINTVLREILDVARA